jgi:transmembrane sensor
MSLGSESNTPGDFKLGEEAAEWVLSLEAAECGPESGFPDEKARNQAFYEWLERSPDHLRVFMETVETQRRMQLIDASHQINIRSLLQAEVIPLHKDKTGLRPRGLEARPRDEPARTWRSELPGRLLSKRVLLRGLAAAALAVALGVAGHWWSSEQNIYTTKIGEQRSTKLEDGSFIYMNTDSEVEVDFSRQSRNVRLVRGEALFVVERDSMRPFTVTAGDTSVRALGTQFNVRRQPEGAEVAVVEGTVQVTTMDEQAGFPGQKLIAGQEAEVIQGKIAPRNRQTVAETLAWRQRRLVFHDTRLVDVAAEFNRYNVTKIRVEGEAAKDLLLSGIFDADRPQSLILYVANSSEFAVKPEGDDWVIRER